MTRMSLRLDDRGFKQLAAASRKWLREAERIEEAAAERLERGTDGDGDSGVECGLVVMVFEGRSGNPHSDMDGTRAPDAVSGGVGA